jgi:hypothetical protein
MEKNTAAKRVETREAKMWKLRVNVITRHVHSRSDRLRLGVLTCRAYNAYFEEPANTRVQRVLKSPLFWSVTLVSAK